MQTLDTLIRIHICANTRQERDRITRSIQRLTVCGNITRSAGYWYDNPEADIVIGYWLDSDADNAHFITRLVRLLAAHQAVANQEAIFIEVISRRHTCALVVYASDWAEAEETLQGVCNYTQQLLNFFDQR